MTLRPHTLRQRLAALVLGNLVIGYAAAKQLETPPQPTPTFREQCVSFESLDFGSRVSSGLRGRIEVSLGGEPQPLPDVQVAARSVSTGKVHYVRTDTNGSYTLDPLEPGEYQVWTCLDGFDELRFRLVIVPNAKVYGFVIRLQASEASGDTSLVPISEEPT